MLISHRLRKGWPLAAALCLGLTLAPRPAAAVSPLLDESRGVLTIAPLVAKATPAVVNISVSATRPGQTNPLLQDPFFRRFFGGGPGGRQNDENVPQQRVMAAGSGVIIDATKGYVVTNNHVVENAQDIKVTTKDGRQLTGKLVGRDAETDVALVQVPAEGLTALPLGDSDSLQVGDVVLAIGNPFGLGQTVTSGIVSALGRSGLNAEHYENFIQTDAPINPGNSGGALIDTKGNLEGINTAIIAPGGGNVGIGFAVPVNMVKAVVAQIEKNGKVSRGHIGVSIETVTPGISNALKLGEVRGVVVNSVEHGSPAERAGVKSGDVIVDVDGRAIQAASQLRNAVGLKEVGATVKLSILRNGQRQDISMAIEKMAEQTAQVSVPQLQGATFTTKREAPGQGQEVVVSEVRRTSQAYALGLRAGDVVEALNRQPVHSVDDLRSAASEASSGALSLNVRRGDDELMIFAG